MADLAGEWLCTDISGNMDEFLQEMGASWMMRTAASTMSWGKGRVKQIIVQEGDVIEVCEASTNTHDCLTPCWVHSPFLLQLCLPLGAPHLDCSQIKTIGGPKETKDTLQIGGGQQTINTPQGPQLGTVSWRGNTLTITNIENGVVQERYCEGNNLILQITSPSGKVVRRIHERQKQ